MFNILVANAATSLRLRELVGALCANAGRTRRNQSQGTQTHSEEPLHDQRFCVGVRGLEGGARG